MIHISTSESNCFTQSWVVCASFNTETPESVRPGVSSLFPISHDFPALSIRRPPSPRKNIQTMCLILTTKCETCGYIFSSMKTSCLKVRVAQQTCDTVSHEISFLPASNCSQCWIRRHRWRIALRRRIFGASNAGTPGAKRGR